MSTGRPHGPVTASSGMWPVLLYFALCSAVSAKLLFLEENEKCKNDTEPWTCKTASTCDGLTNGAHKIGDMDICGFAGSAPIICCPPMTLITDRVTLLSAQPEGGKIAEQKCREYAQYVYTVIQSPLLLPNSDKKEIDECPITAETLIVGGSPAKRNEFPHMALIGIESKSTPLWFCGGSLISPNFVLTAAHCNISRINATVIVRLGELDILEKEEEDSVIDIKVAQVIDHPLYIPSKAYHDISLLRLETEVELGPSIRPLCLQTTRIFKNKKATASGWGYTSYGNNSVSSSYLQKVLLEISDDDKCVEAYGTRWPKVSQGVKPDIMLCSGGVRGKDTCQGDSGGPLQVRLKDPYCMYSQVGITSFGIGCGSTVPGVYTRVSAYVGWIEKIVWP